LNFSNPKEKKKSKSRKLQLQKVKSSIENNAINLFRIPSAPSNFPDSKPFLFFYMKNPSKNKQKVSSFSFPNYMNQHSPFLIKILFCIASLLSFLQQQHQQLTKHLNHYFLYLRTVHDLIFSFGTELTSYVRSHSSRKVKHISL